MVYLPALKDEQHPPSVGGGKVLEEELDHGDLKGVRICYSKTGEQRLQYTSSSLGSFIGGLVFPAGQGSRERRRRRHLRASVFALALPLSLGPGWAVWTAIPKASAPVRGPQRRLLGSLLQVRLDIRRCGVVQVTSLLVCVLGALGEGEGSCHWKEEPSASGPMLLGTCAQSLHPFLQENPEVFGYLLGTVAAFGSWASRIPPFSNIVRLGWGWGYRAS